MSYGFPHAPPFLVASEASGEPNFVILVSTMKGPTVHMEETLPLPCNYVIFHVLYCAEGVFRLRKRLKTKCARTNYLIFKILIHFWKVLFIGTEPYKDKQMVDDEGAKKKLEGMELVIDSFDLEAENTNNGFFIIQTKGPRKMRCRVAVLVSN